MKKQIAIWLGFLMAFGAVEVGAGTIPGTYGEWFANAVPSYPSAQWTGTGAELLNNDLSVTSRAGVTHTAPVPADDGEFVKLTVSFADTAPTKFSSQEDLDALAATLPTSEMKFAICIVEGEGGGLSYVIYARTAPEGNPCWTTLSGLTPARDTSGEVNVEYEKTFRTIRVLGATNAETFYACGEEDFKAMTSFKGQGQVETLSAKLAKAKLEAQDVPVNLPLADVRAALGNGLTADELAAKLAAPAANGLENYKNIALGIPQDQDGNFKMRPFLKAKADDANTDTLSFQVGGVAPKTDAVKITYSVLSAESLDFSGASTESENVSIGAPATAELPKTGGAVKYYRVNFNFDNK